VLDTDSLDLDVHSCPTGHRQEDVGESGHKGACCELYLLELAPRHRFQGAAKVAGFDRPSDGGVMVDDKDLVRGGVNI
jgi:hypothetical protein